MLRMHPCKKLIIQEADLDTCLAAYILGVGESDPVEVRTAEASPEELADPGILCIEAGGSGDWRRGNFDHHDPARYFPAACRQALDAVGGGDAHLERLTDYVRRMDEACCRPDVEFPSLGHLFSGLRLCEGNPKKVFFAGIGILESIHANRIDPFVPLPRRPQWSSWLSAKQRDMEKIADLVQQARLFTTRSGLRVGAISVPLGERGCTGGLYELYAAGCQAGIIFHPEFGAPPIPKFTIGGNQVPVASLLPYFDRYEAGWGGRETIIGSPRCGTRLRQDEVLSIVQEVL